jgi:hypothetical protein
MVVLYVQIDEASLPAAPEGVSPLNAAIESVPGSGQIVTMTVRRRADGQLEAEITIDMPSPASGGMITAWAEVAGLSAVAEL